MSVGSRPRPVLCLDCPRRVHPRRDRGLVFASALRGVRQERLLRIDAPDDFRDLIGACDPPNHAGLRIALCVWMGGAGLEPATTCV